ncbi:EAL domain-containing protein [Peribacillus saganii]|uniref:EAL domain-containing protein n=1 Tax=Peribacillus saganii TaxID=2303992 RepID=A0A372LTF8_9BACI|nr:EAL domain-containing protein [Peribacillus saganii]RFU71479.1 EAL domain-containing protein [Peribacillus saganii]
MFAFKNFVPRLNSENFLLLALVGLVLFTSGIRLTWVYGITFTFTSIFLFLLLRLFGHTLAILSGLVALLFVPDDNISLAYQFVLVLEVMFVGAFFYRGRKAKMFFVDVLFWFTIGLASVFFLYRTGLSGDALYFQICKDIINSFFNVLMADMLLAYFPFYKLMKSIKLNKNNVSIHQFLTHVTLISILVPFFISVATNVLNVHEFIARDLVKQAENKTDRIAKEMLLLDEDDLQNLSLNDNLLLKDLGELAERNKSQEYDLIILNPRNKVIASSSSSVSVKKEYDWHLNYEVNKVSNDFYEALPKGRNDVMPISKWAEGKYIYVKTIDSLSMKIMIQFPIIQFQNQIYNDFLDLLVFSLLFAFCTVILAMAVSRIFMNSLKQLTIATTGLPQKLIQFETVEWPQSNVSELRLLTHNLMKMAAKLTDLFQESNEMNRQLTDQTTKLKESEDKLHQLAFYDVLTRLPNRLHFQNYVNNLIVKNGAKHIAIIFIDLNQFKRINDTLGHYAGDELLQMTANKLSILRNNKREVFRLGGDEFVVVHSAENQAEVTYTVEEILKEFSAFFPIQGQRLYITASVGISMFPQDGKDLDTLVKCADTAMYISKEKGGTVPQFFNESMRNRFQERLLIENALRQAVDTGDFELYYQPKIKSGKVSSMEALIRWQDPVLGFVSPGTFIPIAEEIGLILQIDEWSLIEACKQNKKWQDEGLIHVPISANLSAKHFQHDFLIALIEKTLNESGMDPKYLKLEITESVFIKNPKHVAEVIHKLKSLGVLISIDDFGKGYSSLSQLLQLPIDEIKIDRQFIKDIDQHYKKELLVKSIFDIAHGLRLNVVAEGVETENERELLVQLGCDELQGYLFSPPVSRRDMEKFLCRKVEVRKIAHIITEQP